MAGPRSRSDALHGRLLTRLRGMRAGERLPSVRQLMEEHGVSQVTIDRAMARLRAEGYVEARPARGLFATGKSLRGTIGLLVHDLYSPFDALVIRRARGVLGGLSYDLRVATFALDQGLAPALEALPCDGLLVMPSSLDRIIAELLALRPSATPTVLLDLVPGDLDLNAVGSDNALGGALAARHLLDLGHRRLALVLSEPDVESQRARISGFLTQAELNGARVEVVRCLDTVRSRRGHIPGGSYAVAHFALGELLRERGSPGFTGIFADSDMGVLGSMKALHEAGIAMPGQVSVVGFDDLAEARYFHPALTTIRQDLDGWMRAAVAIIESRLAGESGPAQRVRVRPELVLRESSGPCPAATS